MLKKRNDGLGIFGGSFDPAHKAHLKISKISLSKLKLRKIFWIITRKNPLKKKPFFSLKERILKSKKIIGDNKKIQVKFIDDIISSSSTIKVIRYYKNIKKQKNIYLIVGSDCLIDFHKWKDWKKIVEMVKLVVFSRKGYDNKGNRSTVVKYLTKKNIIFIKNKPINISSTDIRRRKLN